VHPDGRSVSVKLVLAGLQEGLANFRRVNMPKESLLANQSTISCITFFCTLQIYFSFSFCLLLKQDVYLFKLFPDTYGSHGSAMFSLFALTYASTQLLGQTMPLLKILRKGIFIHLIAETEPMTPL
jgi:hypothetical protein